MIKIYWKDKAFLIKAKTGFYTCYLFDFRSILKSIVLVIESYLKGY